MSEMEAAVAGSMGKVKAHAEEGGVAIQGAGKKAEDTKGNFSNLTGSVSGMAEAFGAFEGGKYLAEQFDDVENATAGLKSAMKASGEAIGPDFEDKLQSAQDTGAKFGFSAQDVTNSLDSLRLAGIDTTQGIAAQGAIMDLARAKHIDLATATDAVVKGMQGQGKALKDLNITLPATLPSVASLTSAQNSAAAADATAQKAKETYLSTAAKFGDNSKQAVAAHNAYEAAQAKATAADQKAAQIKDQLGNRTAQFGAVLDDVSGKTSGSAAAASDTLSGRMDALKTQVTDVGMRLVGAAMPALSGFVGVLGTLSQHMNIVIPVLGAFVLAFAAMKVISFVQGLIEGFQAVLAVFSGITTVIADTNPLFLAFTVIAVVLIALQAKFGIFNGVIAALGPVMQAVGDVFKKVFEVMTTIFTIWFNVMKTYYTILFDIMTAPFRLAVAAIQLIWKPLSDFFGSVGSVLGKAFSTVKDAILNPFKAAFNAVATLWNSTIGQINVSIPGWVPGIGGDGFSVPKIPTFHGGGTVQGLPGQEVLALLRAGEHVQATPGYGRVGRGGGGDVHVNVSTNANPYEIAAQVNWAMKTGGA